MNIVNNNIRDLMWKDIRNKRFTLIGMGSELAKMADEQSADYEQLKSKYIQLDTEIKKKMSYLDGSYKARNLIKAATNAKNSRDEEMSKKGGKSQKLEEKLEALEFKREEEIQQIRKLKEAIESLSDDKKTEQSNNKEDDEVLQKAKAWKIRNEMVKRSLNLRNIDARIGMCQIRKCNQDAKDIRDIRKCIDNYNNKITRYKKEIDDINERRPKKDSEQYTRSNDWVLGAVTVDRDKKLKEILDKNVGDNIERRRNQQEKYATKSQQEASNLPYKELKDMERNELIEYSEKITTLKELTEFLKIKAARMAGKTVGLARLAIRKVKSKLKGLKTKEEDSNKTDEQKMQEFIEKSKMFIPEIPNKLSLEKTAEELNPISNSKPQMVVNAVEPEKTVEEINLTAKAPEIETKPVKINVNDLIEEVTRQMEKVERQKEKMQAEQLKMLEEKDKKIASKQKSKTKVAEKSNEVDKVDDKNSIRKRVSVGNDIKDLLDEVTIQIEKEQKKQLNMAKGDNKIR